MFSKKRLRQRAGAGPPELPTAGAGAGGGGAGGGGGDGGGLEGRPLGAATTQTGELEDFGEGLDQAW